MVKIKILMHRSKPVGVFLAEQQQDIEILFYNFQAHHKEFDISPTFTVKGSIIKAVGDRYGEYTVHIDKAANLSNFPVEDIPFIILGDGDILLKMATTLDRRKEELMDLDQKKKRPGMLFGDDDEGGDSGGMGGLFGDDESSGDGDSLPVPSGDEPGEETPEPEETEPEEK